MGTHTPFVRCCDNFKPSKSFTMYKLFVLAAVLATATAEGFYPAGYAGYGGLYGAGIAGLGYGGYAGGYAGLGYAGLGYAGLAHHAVAAPVVAAAPAVAAPVIAAAPIARNYAVPAPRVIAEEPIVEKIVEPVEQWGYKI